ncbi:MAG: formylglycine-generating enzyme family protein [Candidatus Coatesbacteria bacterium]|nr:formylglycine-generating enzyme family protein [Candidatus Coatesbacteria bacterium]
MRAATVFFVMMVCVLLPNMGGAYPAIAIETDTAFYQTGDTIEVGISAWNTEPGVSADVYIGILLPNGGIFSYSHDNWCGEIYPWIRDIYIPDWFQMDYTPFWRIDVPCSLPPISEDDTYYMAALLTQPGTFNWISDLSLAKFNYLNSSSTELTMLVIPGGPFVQGSPTYEEGHNDDESPQRTVDLQAFTISKTEITQKQFRDVMGWNDSYFEGDDLPVERVSWFDCVSFCNKLSAASGRQMCYIMTNIEYYEDHITWADVTWDHGANGYRLPTEAEWECACRAGTTTRYYSGDTDVDVGCYMWYCSNSGSTTHPVGDLEANPWGLYDMSGNVWEWCWDWYAADYYSTGPDLGPVGPGGGVYRVLRGGSYYNSHLACRSACRFDLMPRDRRDNLGFRVAKNFESSSED